jgi:hypothetical protein
MIASFGAVSWMPNRCRNTLARFTIPQPVVSMINRRRLYRMIEGVLLRLGGLTVLLLVLRPKWSGPGDFYLGHPKRFYVTQYDVHYPYVSVWWFLWDVALYAIPVFAIVFLLLNVVHLCPFIRRLAHIRRLAQIPATQRVLAWRPSSIRVFLDWVTLTNVRDVCAPQLRKMSAGWH